MSRRLYRSALRVPNEGARARWKTSAGTLYSVANASISASANICSTHEEHSMADRQNPRTPDMGMDATTLYREEIYTDRSAATLRVMVPVKSDGSEDSARERLYLGEAQIM